MELNWTDEGQSESREWLTLLDVYLDHCLEVSKFGTYLVRHY